METITGVQSQTPRMLPPQALLLGVSPTRGLPSRWIECLEAKSQAINTSGHISYYVQWEESKKKKKTPFNDLMYLCRKEGIWARCKSLQRYEND